MHNLAVLAEAEQEVQLLLRSRGAMVDYMAQVAAAARTVRKPYTPQVQAEMVPPDLCE
jgi:hypothetical protein